MRRQRRGRGPRLEKAGYQSHTLLLRQFCPHLLDPATCQLWSPRDELLSPKAGRLGEPSGETDREARAISSLRGMYRPWRKDGQRLPRQLRRPKAEGTGCVKEEV